MKTTLIIGYGNTLRSDDGVGQMVAETVASWGLEKVRSLSVHQLTPELADDMAQSEIVIFVDAFQGDRVIMKTLDKTLENERDNYNFGHISSPEFLLVLTEKLYQKKPQCYWLLIPAINFDFGEKLSEITKKEMRTALKMIREIINS